MAVPVPVALAIVSGLHGTEYASILAVERLIQPEGVERVARAAIEDFARIRWKHVWQRDTRWSELCRDMAAAGLPLP